MQVATGCNLSSNVAPVAFLARDPKYNQKKAREFGSGQQQQSNNITSHSASLTNFASMAQHSDPHVKSQLCSNITVSSDISLGKCEGNVFYFQERRHNIATEIDNSIVIETVQQQGSTKCRAAATS